MSEVAPKTQRSKADTRSPPVCPTDKDDTVELRKQTRTFDYVWRSGVAGGLAGCAAKTVVAPLDRVKILFQASNPQFAKYTGSWFGVATAMKDIKSHEGVLGLFRGHSATLLRIFPYAGIKFLAYEQIRSIIIRNKDQETPWRRLLSGSMAGVTSVFFTYPLEVVRRFVRTTAKPTGTVVDAVAAPIAAIAPRSGLANFYRGFSPTLLGMLPYAGMSFLTHDTVGDILRLPSFAKYTTLSQPKNAPEGKAAPLRSWAELLAGGVAGLVSQTTSYPLEVIRRRMQVGGAVGDGHRLRISETAAMIFRERGVPGFFVGLTIGYVKVFPLAAVSFYTYERAKTWLGI
uniref:Mitochondrial thiamine pyrophosphate carrier 1 n=1 Tax=Colletotrichum fructicola (strain Nara gc5) TaxID=1213859 RepID=L2GBJ8_COLFN